jgi:MFS family permease
MSGNHGPTTSPVESRHFDILLAEYHAGREDNRHSLTQQSALIVAAVTALGALLTVEQLKQPGNLQRVLLSGIAFAIGTYMAIYFAAASIRQRYQAAIEAELAKRTQLDIGRSITPDPYPAPVLHAPALFQVERVLNSQRRGNRVVWATRMLYAVMLTVPAGVVSQLALGIHADTLTGWYLQHTVLFSELVYFLFLIWVVWTTIVSPKRFIAKVVRTASQDRLTSQGRAAAADSGQDRRSRSLQWYLFWPRLAESFKAGYFLLACAVGFVVGRPGAHAVVVALIFWFAFEALAYQARYAWNDLRDADDDANHPTAAERRRIPRGRSAAEDNANLHAVAMMILVRMALAIAVVVMLVKPIPGRTTGLLILATLVVQAAGYECVRLITKRPERARQPSAALRSPRVTEYCVYVLVGTGYGLRAVAGLWFGSGFHAAPVLLIGTFVFLSALGAANAMTVWLLEGATLAGRNTDGHGPTVRKSHVSSLWNLYVSKKPASVGLADDPSRVAWLRNRDPAWSPWFLGYVVAATAAAVVGLLLWNTASVRPGGGTLPGALGWPIYPIAAGSAVLVLLALARLPARAGWHIGLGAPLVVTVAVVVPRHDASLTLAALPFALLVVIYLATRSSSYHALAGGAATLMATAAANIRALCLTTLEWAVRATAFTRITSRTTQARMAARRDLLDQRYAGRVRPRWFGQLALASVAVWSGFMGPILFLLPLQVEKVAPGNKDRLLGIILAAGAATAAVANVAAGYLSDRTRAEFGRRRPYILVGALAAAATLVLAGATTTWWQVLVVWCLAQTFLNAMLAGVVALLPDLVPKAQRATAAGVFSAAQIAGPVIGGAIAAALPGAAPLAWAMLAVLLVVLPIPLLIGTREKPRVVPDEGGAGRRSTLGEFRTRVLADPDMRWAFATRFCFQSAITAGTTYLLYYLGRTVATVDPNLALTILSAVLGLALAATALLVGPIADATHGLPRYVAQAGTMMAVGSVILAMVATLGRLSVAVAWPAITLATALLGVAFGLYAPIDLAINTRVLRNETRHGTHLGMLNSASALPQTVGSLVAVSTATATGTYTWLYLASAFLALLGSGCVRRIHLDRLPIR